MLRDRRGSLDLLGLREHLESQDSLDLLGPEVKQENEDQEGPWDQKDQLGQKVNQENQEYLRVIWRI